MSRPKAPMSDEDGMSHETGPLFARARRADPETSHAAAREVTESGAAAKQAKAVWWVLQTFGGPLTSAEVAAKHSTLDRYQAARRLPELRAAGWVKNGEARTCSVTGRKALTWETC